MHDAAALPGANRPHPAHRLFPVHPQLGHELRSLDVRKATQGPQLVAELRSFRLLSPQLVAELRYLKGELPQLGHELRSLDVRKATQGPQLVAELQGLAPESSQVGDELRYVGA